MTVQYSDTDRHYERKFKIMRLTWKRHDTTCQSPGDIEHKSVTHINTILTIHTQTARSVAVILLNELPSYKTFLFKKKNYIILLLPHLKQLH